LVMLRRRPSFQGDMEDVIPDRLIVTRGRR
jgi:hypothetical protein